ncbi:hypothetical protein CO641_09325 [Lysobacteraceae bacterium NML91-0213]|nr:hypothetical protein CO641_09325 [Xanthomonadaceae bacterium NML91-0213]
MPTLLLPAGLFALAALLLPVLVHLARRQTLVPTPFAALRWLRAKARPRRQVRVDEWPLLLLRLLLLALFALWLARPATPETAPVQRWSVLVPGVDPAALPPARADEQRRWLAPGWPRVDAVGAGMVAVGATGSLLRQLDMELPAGVALTVHVPDPLDGADAQRPRLSRAVDWRPLPRLQADPPGAPAPPRLAIRHDPEHAQATRYLRAAASAWRAPDGRDDVDTAGPELAVPDTADTLAWLVAGEVPAPVRDFAAAGGTVLLAADATWATAPLMAPAWRDADGVVLAQGRRHGRGRILHLQRPLRLADWPQLGDPAFPAELRRQLQPVPPPMRAPAADYAPQQDDLRWPAALQDLRGPLLWLILLLLAIERWLATSPRRAAAP